MSTWFYYYDNNGQKQRATVEQIKELAQRDMITPETVIESEAGKQTPAGKIKGIIFQAPNDLEDAKSTVSFTHNVKKTGEKNDNEVTERPLHLSEKLVSILDEKLSISGETLIGSLVGTIVVCIALLVYFYFIAPPNESTTQWQFVGTIVVCGVIWLILSICGFIMFNIDPRTGKKYQFSDTKEKIYNDGCGLGCVGFLVLMSLGSMGGAIYIASIDKTEWKQNQERILAENAKEGHVVISTEQEQGSSTILIYGLICMFIGFFAIIIAMYGVNDKPITCLKDIIASIKELAGWRIGLICFAFPIFFAGCLMCYFRLTQISKTSVIHEVLPGIEQNQHQSSSAEEWDATRYAKDVVRSRLKSPSTAKFVEWMPLAEYSRSSGQWRISGSVDAQNSFGATIRSYYMVEVKKVNGLWQTISFSMINDSQL